MGVRGTIRRFLIKNYPSLYKKLPFLWPDRKLRKRILRDWRRNPERYATPELTGAMNCIFHSGISVFMYPDHEKYGSFPVEVHEDSDGLPYVVHNGRRLYMRRGYTPEWTAGVYRALIVEQDPASPHCYQTDGFEMEEGDVLFDIGAAEGNFSLDNVEKASRIFLFETDPTWIEPLQRTFEPWKDKVVIINKYASDADGSNTVTVDTVVREYGIEGPIFLKIDVEGAEDAVLRGAEEVLSRKDTRAVICTYHRQGDHMLLSGMMEERGFGVTTSEGHMLFIRDRKNLQPPFFRRGVIYCTK